MKTVLTFLRHSLTALAREAKRDDGVLALVIAIALIAAAATLIATTARQNKEAEVARMSGNAKTVKLLKNSVLAFYLTDPDGAGTQVRNGRIACPDTDFDGDENFNDPTCTSARGTVPWRTLGLNQDDAIDAYGNYFTYVVTNTQSSLQVCKQISNEYNSAQAAEYTGTVNPVSDTEALTSSQSSGAGTNFSYAFISHGPNKLGGINRSGTSRSAPTSSAELQNCPAGISGACSVPSGSYTAATTVITGPQNTTSSTYFDDVVYLSERGSLTKLCESLTPGQKANAFMNEKFDGMADGNITDSNATVQPENESGATSQVTTSSGTNKVLVFTSTSTASAAIRSRDQYNPGERPIYISMEWTPTVSSTEAGISIATRATSGTSNRGTGDTEDIFTTDGITVRFYDDGTNVGSANNHHIYICENGTSACDSGTGNNLASSGTDTFTIQLNHTYTVEVYDDGVNIWGRISDNAGSNSATISYDSSAPTALPVARQDFGGQNYVMIISHGPSTSQIDNLLIGRGALALDTSTTTSYVDTNDADYEISTGNITLEAWIKPNALPTGTARSTILSKWTHDPNEYTGSATTAASDQAYRLSLISSGISLDLSRGSGGSAALHAFSFGYKPTVSLWTHIAVTYDSSSATATLYVNGEASGTARSSATSNTINSSSTASFKIGGELNNSAVAANGFNGSITDVRIWNTTRIASDIFDNHKVRLSLTDGAYGTALIANFTLDRDASAVFGATSATLNAASTATTNGTFSSSPAPSYTATLQTFFPPFADAICGGSLPGHVAGTYQCDFRDTADSGDFDIPANLASVSVKAWGGGGGGYDAAALTYPTSGYGGGGGFSVGRMTAIDSVTIAGRSDLRVDVGGGGSMGSGRNGSGGGGASGLWRDVDLSSTVTTGDFAGIVAGGGGGASYGDDDLSSVLFGGAGPDCTSAGVCGPGGGGGGAGVTTSRAVDAGTNLCGGRGANNTPTGTPPPNTSYCPNGGSAPSANVGGTGGGTVAGGTSLLGAGGNGHNGTAIDGTHNAIGAGGAGGGISISDMTAGGGQSGGYGVNSTILNTLLSTLLSLLDTLPTDYNVVGFGGGGGAGFADSAAVGVSGAAGSALTPGASTTDPDYAPSYCTASGSTCPTTTPGRGGNAAAGTQGAVIIKW